MVPSRNPLRNHFLLRVSKEFFSGCQLPKRGSALDSLTGKPQVVGFYIKLKKPKTKPKGSKFNQLHKTYSIDCRFLDFFLKYKVRLQELLHFLKIKSRSYCSCSSGKQLTVVCRTEQSGDILQMKLFCFFPKDQVDL